MIKSAKLSLNLGLVFILPSADNKSSDTANGSDPLP
jgi:hypothetical protein